MISHYLCVIYQHSCQNTQHAVIQICQQQAIQMQSYVCYNVVDHHHFHAQQSLQHPLYIYIYVYTHTVYIYAFLLYTFGKTANSQLKTFKLKCKLGINTVYFHEKQQYMKINISCKLFFPFLDTISTPETMAKSKTTRNI